MNRDTGKALFWNTLGNLVYAAAQWIITVMVIRLSGYGDAGVLSLAMSISAAFQTVATFGIRNYQVSDVSGQFPDSCYAGLRNITCLAAYLLCLGFSLINGYTALQLQSIMLLMLFRTAESYSDMLHGVAQKNGRLDIAGKGRLINATALLTGFFAGYCLTGKMTAGLLAMSVLSFASVLCYDLQQVRKLSGLLLYDSLRRCLLLARKTLPMFGYQFLISTLYIAPRYILEAMTDEASFGGYSAVYAPVSVIQLIINYMYAPFLTRLTELHAGGRYKEFNKLCLAVTGVFGIFAAVVFIGADILGEWAYTLIYGASVSEYLYLLYPIIAGGMLSGYLAFACVLETVVRDLLGMLAGLAAGLAVSVISTPLLVGLQGMNGASTGLLIGSLTAVLICLWNVRRQQKKSERKSV